MSRFIRAAVIGAALTVAAPVAAQFDHDAAQRELAGRNQQLQQMEQQMYIQASRDPRVQYDYRRHLAGGGRMSWPDFVVWHARTNGGTQDFNPQMPNRPSTMDQSVYDGRAGVLAGSVISRPDRNGNCWYVGGNSDGLPAACRR
jgi:type II secretory pathway pseudopilin PulG